MNFKNKKFLKIKKINRINVKNGDVFKFLDRKSNFYSKFGEIYFSKIKYNKIKNNCIIKKNIKLFPL